MCACAPPPPPPRPSYECQVSLNSDFSGGYPGTNDRIILGNDTVSFDPALGVCARVCDVCVCARVCVCLCACACEYGRPCACALCLNLIALLTPPVPFAYPVEYVWKATGLVKTATYYVRCRAYLDTYYGPWCPSLPPSIVADVYVAVTVCSIRANYLLLLWM